MAAETSTHRIPSLPQMPRIPRPWGEIGYAILLGVSVIGLYLTLQNLQRPWQNDAYGFYVMWQGGGLYEIPWLDHLAFVYSPAFAHAITPLTENLSWNTFSTLWNTLQLAALIVMVGPIWAAALIWLLPWPATATDVNAVYGTLRNGNPQFILALAVVVGFRLPAAWAAVILMKVTPGIGLVWFAVRREWRNLAWALGATVAIASVSIAFAPNLWLEWFDQLRQSAASDALTHEPILPLPLLVRLPLAAALVAWGGLTNRYWTVPIGAMLGLPAIQVGGFVVAVSALCFLPLPFMPRFWREWAARG
jgi:hypothetical protein